MAQVAEVDLVSIVKEIWPYLIALFVVLLLITFVPSFSMWVPTALGF